MRVGIAMCNRDVPVPMAEGTLLRASIYRPRAPGRYPVLIKRTAYDLAQRVESRLLGRW